MAEWCVVPLFCKPRGTKEGTTNRVNRVESILIEIEALKESDFITYNVQK